MSVKIDRTGETRVNNQGLKMTIVAYRSNMDIDVKFEDSTVVCNLAYHAFRKGQVKHPNFYSIQRGGMSTTNHQGLKMTIVNYVGCMDIDVQFEDGTIIRHSTYGNFVKRSISNPNYHSPVHRADRLEESNIANNGMRMTIIAYRSCTDLDVQFEDGTIKSGVSYIRFKSGKIKHPFPYQIGNITMKRPAYIYNNEGNFYCFCNKCKRSDIMSIQEIKNHTCK